MTYATVFSVELTRMCNETVTLIPKSSYNTYGELQYGSGSTYIAYVHRITGSKRSVTSNEHKVEYRVYIPSTSVAATVDDTITTADGLTRPIVEVDIHRDQYGQQCAVLGLGVARSF
jgi:hypothetical protein